MDKELYKVRWTTNALEDHKRIVEYLLEEWPVYVADTFASKLEKKISGLSGQPFVGKISSKRKNVRSILITKHNRLYYRIKKNVIELLGFVDTRQHPSKNKFEK